MPVIVKRMEGRMRRGKRWSALERRVVCAGLTVTLVLMASGTVRAETAPQLDDFSPAFLGMYRKVMEIEDEIRRHATRYGVDFDLARAVCLHESGGNAGLASHAGAQGYFQLMPRTYRELRVTTNIEAGVKYLARLVQQFGREDRAIAAYNGGPGRVARGTGLPIETLQYVIGVGHYRTVLKQYDGVLRQHASSLQLGTVRSGDDWSTLSDRLGIPSWELRLHNPFLASRRLRAGDRIVHPPESRPDLLAPFERGALYRVRHGDNYIMLAIALELDLEALRAENGLWQLQSVPPGVVLRIPLSIDRADIIAGALFGGAPGPSLRPEPALAGSVPATSNAGVTNAAPVVHRVRPGETLISIARRYGTTVSAIQETNNLRDTTIRVGQSLLIRTT
jgi:LysM repeat protein